VAVVVAASEPPVLSPHEQIRRAVHWHLGGLSLDAVESLVALALWTLADDADPEDTPELVVTDEDQAFLRQALAVALALHEALPDDEGTGE
jgi:hypothetical protein